MDNPIADDLKALYDLADMVLADHERVKKAEDERRKEWGNWMLLQDYYRASGPHQVKAIIERTSAAEAQVRELDGALRRLLGCHCCDSCDPDYKAEWWDDETTVCNDCRPARIALQEPPCET